MLRINRSNLRIGAKLVQSRAVSFTPRPNVRITHANVPDDQKHLFSAPFLHFLRQISGEFQPRYAVVHKKRLDVIAAGMPIALREDTKWIRDDPSWKGPPIVPQLEKRWVEITGPASDRKMMINALNSGANCYMADLEDSQSPEWFGMVKAQQNLFDAARGTLTHTYKDSIRGPGVDYAVNADAATLLVRARGVHMLERHVVDEANRPMPAGLFDIAMYMFHNAQKIISKGGVPLLYVPKLESFEEAVLVHDVIEQIEAQLGITHGTTRVTALIETLPGILQAEEIGFALGPYWAGLNCGRWDHIFSILKNQATNPDSVFPDRSLLGMTTPFLTQYMQRIVQVCHSRGVHAMGGMSALIPSKDAKQTEIIMGKVVNDKEYELANGCDGAWVAHPAMVNPIKEVFERGLAGEPHQISSKMNLDFVVIPENLVQVPPALRDVKNYTEAGLRSNVSVGISYLSAWLDGAGAVAINGLMEDLATAEISRTQVWQWLHHQQKFTRDDGKVAALDQELLSTIWGEEVAKLKQTIENSKLSVREKTLRLHNFNRAAKIFLEMVCAPELAPFIQDVAYDTLNEEVTKPVPLRQSFKAMDFPEEEKAKLRGTRAEITLDARLSILRGQHFNNKMAAVRPDGIVAHGNFIGTPNGHSARNVVEGGMGYSWPYIGGWELNARGLQMGQPMPDTLSVNFHEQGDLAVVINRFLEMGDRVQELECADKLSKIEKMPESEREQAKMDLLASKIDFLTQPMLADLEQGWGDPKKVFLSVVRCLQNGVNIMHIEDQYSLKRCGHLGGKGLDDIYGWVTTMKAANLAASIFPGVKRDGSQQNVNFVARTDALSAEFIQYSNKMHDPEHPDHFFIDWDRGFTPDGRYLYLKKGKNPATGRKMGLEHSARRCAEIVRLGLASHVWMETPDANVADAKMFMGLVNESLAPHGVFARGLYNHSPSFIWDVSFFIESTQLAKEVAEYIETDILKPLDGGKVSLQSSCWKVKNFLKNYGDRVRGDYNFEDDLISQILGNGLDLARGEVDWRAMVDEQSHMLDALGPSLQTYKANKELQRIDNNGYKPLRHITNIITAQRLKNFKDRLSDAGFEVHLCTLPLYPSDAHTANALARGMAENGIHDFVVNQRAARKYQDKHGTLTSFHHQKATGTGWEVMINTIVGTSNTDILSGSTEVADEAKEKSLKGKGTGPSTCIP